MTRDQLTENFEKVVAIGSTVAYCAKLGADLGMIIGGAGLAKKVAVVGGVLGLATVVVLLHNRQPEDYSYARLIDQQR